MDGLKNFVRGFTFLVAAVGGGLIGSVVSGGSIWGIIGLAVVGSAIGIGLGILFVSLLDRAGKPSRKRRPTVRATTNRGPKTQSSAFSMVVWALLLGLFLLFLTTLTRQSIINNNIVGMVLGPLLSLIPFTVIFFYLMRWVFLRKSLGDTQAWVGAALAVVAVLGLFVFFWTTAERKPQLKAGYWDAITSACGGLGVAGAAPYDPSPHLRPIALSNSKKLWYDSMPLEWVPSDVTTTELVACVGESERYTIEVCPYYGSSVTRYGYRRQIELVSALTAEAIASKIFDGPPPRKCRSSESANLTKLEGKEVTQFRQVSTWLSTYVEP